MVAPINVVPALLASPSEAIPTLPDWAGKLRHVAVDSTVEILQIIKSHSSIVETVSASRLSLNTVDSR